MSDIDPDSALLAAPDAPDASGTPGRAVQRTVARMRHFAGSHDGATAMIEHLGRNGARVILLGGDGIYGDVVLGSVELADRVCAAAGLRTAGWDRERSAALRISAADRRRMAGTGR